MSRNSNEKTAIQIPAGFFLQLGFELRTMTVTLVEFSRLTTQAQAFPGAVEMSGQVH